MMTFNSLSSIDNFKYTRHQTRYRPEANLETDTVYFADSPLETLAESQQDGKHGIKNLQLLETVFIVRMSMNLSGLRWILEARNPRIAGVEMDGNGCYRMLSGGSAWESNPPNELLTRYTGFEVRSSFDANI